MSYFIPPLETFQQEAEEIVRNVNPIDVDAAADLRPLFDALEDSLRTGEPYRAPAAPKTIVAKTGRSIFFGDRLEKSADDWNETIEVSAPIAKSASMSLYVHRGDMSDEEVAAEDAKDAAYCKLIDSGTSHTEAHAKVYGSV